MQVKFQIQSINTCGLTYMPIVQFCAGNPTLVKDTCNVKIYLKYCKHIKYNKYEKIFKLG